MDQTAVDKEYSSLTKLPVRKVGRRSENLALQLFHRAAEQVPAYRKFLAEYKINHRKIKSLADFEQVPYTDKDNYIRKYPLEQLAWQGRLYQANTIASSTGSTGQPMFWPRDDQQDHEVSWLIELIFRSILEPETRSTLVVNTFALGLWSAGVFMLTGSLVSARKNNYRLTMVSPGINKSDIFKSITQLASKFDQVLLVGYPPFVKDLIDEGAAAGINWKKMRLKFFFGGDGFSETWRNYLLDEIGGGNPLLDTANVYGTSEAGLPGIETPVSIAVKRLAAEDADLSQSIFRSERQPFVYQYNPLFKFMQVVDNEIIFTCQNVTPFIRYNIHDQGGVIGYDDMMSLFGPEKVAKTLKQHKAERFNYQLPFVYLFGRPQNTATLYGLNVYPENVKAGLEDKQIRHLVSGKFRMSTEYKTDQNQYLLLRIESARDIKITAAEKRLIMKVLSEKLLELNGEYRKLHDAIGEKSVPMVQFVPHGDPAFAPGMKTKLTEKK